MVQQIAQKTAVKMSEHNVIEARTFRIYAYGLDLLFSSLAGLTVLIIISALLGKSFLWIPYMVGFVPLRLSGGGYHAKTHTRCIFIFSLLYSLSLLIQKLCTIPVEGWLVACLVNLIIVFLFSPVQATNKPLKGCQCKTNRQKSLFLGICNLLGCIVIISLLTHKSQWVNMYFMGSSMGGISMLLAIMNHKLERRKRYESNN